MTEEVERCRREYELLHAGAMTWEQLLEVCDQRRCLFTQVNAEEASFMDKAPDLVDDLEAYCLKLEDTLGTALLANYKLKSYQASQHLKDASACCSRVCETMKADGLDEDIIEIERLQFVLRDVIFGKLPFATLDDAINTTAVEQAKLCASKRTKESTEIHECFDLLTLSRLLDLECEYLQRKLGYFDSEQMAGKNQVEAANAALHVEVNMVAAGMKTDADAIHELRLFLESGDATGDFLEEASEEQHKKADAMKLEDTKKISWATESLANKLDEAVVLTIDAAVKKNGTLADDSLRKAVIIGKTLTAKFTSSDIETDIDWKHAKELHDITKRCHDIVIQTASSNIVDVAIKDTVTEIARLHAQDRNEEGQKLTEMCEFMRHASKLYQNRAALKRKEKRIIANVEALTKAKVAADATVLVEADLKVAKMVEETAEIHDLRVLLESGDITGEQLEAASKMVQKKSTKLKSIGKKLLAHNMEELSKKVDEAVESTVNDAFVRLDFDASSSIQKALDVGVSAVVDLSDRGDTDFAANVSSIVDVCRDVLAGNMNCGQIDSPIHELAVEVAKLRVVDKEADAKKLEEMLNHMGDAVQTYLHAKSCSRKKDSVTAEIEAAAKEEAAAVFTANVEAELVLGGMKEEAEQINSLRQLLDSREITDTQLQDASKNIMKLATMLQVSGRTEVAVDVGHLNEKLLEAVESNLDAAAKMRILEVESVLKSVIKKSHKLEAILLETINNEGNQTSTVHNITYSTAESHETIEDMRVMCQQVLRAAIMIGAKQSAQGFRQAANKLVRAVKYARQGIRSFKALDLQDHVSDLQSTINEIDTAQNSWRAATILMRKAEYTIAEEQAAEKETQAAKWAVRVEAPCVVRGMKVEANQIHTLRKLLESGKISGEELEKASIDVNATQAKLSKSGHKDIVRYLEELKNKLNEAVKENFDAAHKEKNEKAYLLLQHQAIPLGEDLWAELREKGLVGMTVVENMTQTCKGIVTGQIDWTHLSTTNSNVSKDERLLRSLGKEEEANRLLAIYEILETSRLAFTAGSELEMKESHADSQMKMDLAEEEAMAAVVKVEAALLEQGMNEGVSKIHELRDQLESGDITSDELQKTSLDAHKWSIRLLVTGKKELAQLMDTMADKLDDAMESNIAAEAMAKEIEAEDTFAKAVVEGMSLLEIFKAKGLTEDAKAMDYVVNVCEMKSRTKSDVDHILVILKEKLSRMEGLRQAVIVLGIFKMVDLVEASRDLLMVSALARNKREHVRSEIEAKSKEDLAADAAVHVQTLLDAAGMQAEADAIERLVALIESGNIRGTELEQASKDTLEMMEKASALSGSEQVRLQVSLSDLSTTLAEACPITQTADGKRQDRHASEHLYRAVKLGMAITEELQGVKAISEAAEMNRITCVCKDVLGNVFDKRKGREELTKVLLDGNAQLKQLQKGKGKVAKEKLEEMMHEVELSQTAEFEGVAFGLKAKKTNLQKKFKSSLEVAIGSTFLGESCLLSQSLKDEAKNMQVIRESFPVDNEPNGDDQQQSALEMNKLANRLREEGRFEVANAMKKVRFRLLNISDTHHDLQRVKCRIELFELLIKCDALAQKIEGDCWSSNEVKNAQEMKRVSQTITAALNGTEISIEDFRRVLTAVESSTELMSIVSELSSYIEKVIECLQMLSISESEHIKIQAQKMLHLHEDAENEAEDDEIEQQLLDLIDELKQKAAIQREKGHFFAGGVTDDTIEALSSIVLEVQKRCLTLKFERYYRLVTDLASKLDELVKCFKLQKRKELQACCESLKVVIAEAKNVMELKAGLMKTNSIMSQMKDENCRAEDMQSINFVYTGLEAGIMIHLEAEAIHMKINVKENLNTAITFGSDMLAKLEKNGNTDAANKVGNVLGLLDQARKGSRLAEGSAAGTPTQSAAAGGRLRRSAARKNSKKK